MLHEDFSPLIILSPEQMEQMLSKPRPPVSQEQGGKEITAGIAMGPHVRVMTDAEQFAAEQRLRDAKPSPSREVMADDEGHSGDPSCIRLYDPARPETLTEGARAFHDLATRVAGGGHGGHAESPNLAPALQATESGSYSKPGFYGYVVTEDVAPGTTGDLQRLQLRYATPSDYFFRHAILIQVFGVPTKFEGVEKTPDGAPSIVTSQPYIAGGEHPKPPDIAKFMVRHGFELVLNNGETFKQEDLDGTTWYRPQDGVIVTDTRPQNFLVDQQSRAMVPIDLIANYYPNATVNQGARAIPA